MTEQILEIRPGWRTSDIGAVNLFARMFPIERRSDGIYYVVTERSSLPEELIHILLSCYAGKTVSEVLEALIESGYIKAFPEKIRKDLNWKSDTCGKAKRETKSSRKPKTSSPSSSSKCECKFIITKGPRKGDPCGRPCKVGRKFCYSHSK